MCDTVKVLRENVLSVKFTMKPRFFFFLVIQTEVACVQVRESKPCSLMYNVCLECWMEVARCYLIAFVMERCSGKTLFPRDAAHTKHTEETFEVM